MGNNLLDGSTAALDEQPQDKGPHPCEFLAFSGRVKSALVKLLALVWHCSPPLGVALGRLVSACWPGFREA
jgi:hypothetical protein